MKTWKAFLPIVAAAGLTALAAGNYFSLNGSGTTLAYVVANGGQGVPRLQYVNATSDKATSVLKFYTAGTPNYVTLVSATNQTLISMATTGINTSDVIVSYNVSSGIFQRHSVSSLTTTNLVVGAALTTALAVGDPVFKMTAAGTIPVGAASKELNSQGGAIWNGARGKPLLIDLDGTSACSINSASGLYDP